ncbi:hypothetical protein DYB35_006064 [Aphanomyces astaci]|uniref:SEC7 domain-containing protein n=1 Tax=Aphanomyces astaci TaxID=112090 RepID=A0A3R7EE34_APHAT|nr:hypothetical protein DYB35_006064 [Aphanomyces astaci]
MATLPLWRLLWVHLGPHLKWQWEALVLGGIVPVLTTSLNDQDEHHEDRHMMTWKVEVAQLMVDFLRDPLFVIDGFITYDCAPNPRANVVAAVLDALFFEAKTVHTSGDDGHTETTELACLGVLNALQMLYRRTQLHQQHQHLTCGDDKDDERLPSPETLLAQRQRKQLFQDAITTFNTKPSAGIDLLASSGFLPTPVTPHALATFLRALPRGMDKNTVGQVLGSLGKLPQPESSPRSTTPITNNQSKPRHDSIEFRAQLRQAYVETFELHQMPLVDALRTFLGAFRLPGEAQQIDRILEAFATHEFLVPVAPELPSKGRQVCVEFPLQSGALPGLKRARKVQPFVRKLKKASKKADDPLSRVKFVNLEHATPSVPLREPATAHPLNLNKQALEWLARDVKAELSASKRTTSQSLGVATFTADVYKPAAHSSPPAPSHWLNAQEYLSHMTTQPPNGPLETHVLTPPSFVASKADSSHVALPPSLLPEWTLRSCAPIGGPKPVRLAVICPHSSGDWIATLSHMYMASLRSSYINASLGTFNDGDHETHKNALVIVNKSDDVADPFKTYREAVTDLGRTAFDTTASIFVVAPFGSKFSHRVTDFLGAISSQLDGWQPSFQVVYVEELVETCVHVQPTYFREQSFALYDRLYEPLPAGLAADAYACLPHGVTKKMYHLADPSAAFHVFLGYGLANGWLLSALVTSNGGVMATDAVFIDAPDLRAEDIALLVDKVLHFAALGRDQDAPAAVVATNALARINDQERAIWHDVWESKAIGDTQPVVVNQWVLSSAAVDGDLRWTNRQDADISRAVAVHDAGLIVPSKPANVHGLDRLSAAPNIVQLHVEAILDLSSAKVDGIPVGVTVEILKCFHDLAWLTVHPTTLRQASALPVHLFAVQNMLSLVAPRPTADKTIAHTK